MHLLYRHQRHRPVQLLEQPHQLGLVACDGQVWVFLRGERRQTGGPRREVDSGNNYNTVQWPKKNPRKLPHKIKASPQKTEDNSTPCEGFFYIDRSLISST